MTHDEKMILEYLKSYRSAYVSGKEISRKVGGRKRYDEEGDWAMPILTAMVDALMLETDSLGHYRMKPYDVKKKKQRTYVSPHIAAILKKSGKNFDHILTDQEAEAEMNHDLGDGEEEDEKTAA